MYKIGGEFDIDIHHVPHHDRDILDFSNIFASGRHAFYYIVQQLIKDGIVCLYIPLYICSSITSVLEKCNISVVAYKQSDNLRVILDLDEIKPKSAILLVNYFGFNSSYLDNMKIRNERPDVKIIIDNVQAFFLHKAVAKADYQFTSLRKFFAVPDGADVYSKDDNMQTTQKILKNKSVNKFHIAKLLGSIVKNHDFDDVYYLNYLGIGEQQLDSFHELELASQLGHDLFLSQNHVLVKQRRIENAVYVYERGKSLGLNFLFDNLDEDVVPLCIPVLFENRDSIRKELFNKNIFLPIHWPIDNAMDNNVKKLSEKELSIVIDQRYGLKEMEYMMDCIEDLI